MKLLIVNPYYWPAFKRGGPALSLHYLNKAMVKRGAEVSVYTTNVDLADKVPVNQEVDVDGVRVTYFSFRNLSSLIAGLGWQFSRPLSYALKQNIKSFDLVYIATVWSYPAAIAAYYCRKYKKPYIITPRGMLYPETFSKKAWKKWIYYRLILRRDLEGASAIHYTSKDEEEKTHSFLGLSPPAIIVPNGIELSEFRDSADKEKLRVRYPHLKGKKIILFLGRLNWKKGLDILIKAYKMLLRDMPEARLLIAGGDEEGYGKKIKAWIRKAGISYAENELKNKGGSARITFTGMLTGKDKIETYAGSDIFVLPSYSENFAMTAVEAMACGLAVVISNKVGIYREIERNNAGIVINTRPEDLYQGMKLLLENPVLRNEFALNGRRLVKEYYDIDNVSGSMMTACRKIIESSDENNLY